MNLIDEKLLEKQIDFIVIMALKSLKECFVIQKLNDRKATLGLYFFVKRFVQLAWENKDPVEVLENITKVIDTIGD